MLCGRPRNPVAPALGSKLREEHGRAATLPPLGSEDQGEDEANDLSEANAEPSVATKGAAMAMFLSVKREMKAAGVGDYSCTFADAYSALHMKRFGIEFHIGKNAVYLAGDISRIYFNICGEGLAHARSYIVSPIAALLPRPKTLVRAPARAASRVANPVALS